MEKYLVNGQTVEVVQALDGGKFLVKPVYEQACEYGEPYTCYGNPEIVDAVFDTPPREKWDTAIKELEDKVQALQDAKRQMEQENRQMERELVERRKAYAKHDALKMLDAYIAGKVTHYAVFHGYQAPSILEFGKAVTDERYDSHRQRLLSLYGGSQGDLSWELSRYSSPGSGGSSYECFPCLSYEEALAKVQRWLSGRIDKTKDKPEASIASWAQHFGVALPDGYLTAITDEQIQHHLSRIEQLNVDMKKEHAMIEALQAGQVETAWKA